MKSPRRLSLHLALGALAIGAPTASAQTLRAEPLPDRDAVVIGFRAQSQTVIVVHPSGKMRAVHALRPSRVGTRVRIRGIKWGRLGLGIKWGVRPQGIKWGIKWALNGTFASPLDRTGTRTRVVIRGIVIARSRTALAIATNGGVVTVMLPMGVPAVTGSRTLHGTAPQTGRIVALPTQIQGGVLLADRVKVLGVAKYLPISGRVSGVDRSARTMTIDGTSDPLLPVEITMAVPSTIDIAAINVGDEVATTARRAAAGGLQAAVVSRNESFAAANDPSLVVRVTPPLPGDTRQRIGALVNQVEAAVRSRQISDAAVATAALTQIRAAQDAADDGDRPALIGALDRFVAVVAAGEVAGVVTPQASERLQRLVSELRARL